jgi:hypothetical protein
MEAGEWQETFTETRVTHALKKDGKFYLVQNVPARISEQTGERLYSPDTVERLQKLLWAGEKPVRIIETPVFEFVA